MTPQGRRWPLDTRTETAMLASSWEQVFLLSSSLIPYLFTPSLTPSLTFLLPPSLSPFLTPLFCSLSSSFLLNLCFTLPAIPQGTNACYMERLDAVKKFTGDRSRYSQVIINTEWGAFGADGELKEWMTAADCELDKHVATNKGQQM